MINDKKLISIICPVFNEAESVLLFYERLQKALVKLRASYDFELIFTNNRSTDETLKKICQLRQQDPTVQVLTMSRNFGYQASVQAGLTAAKGVGIIVIDVDGEDPPELIGEFLEKWEEGYDVVYGIREYHHKEWWIIKKARKTFYRMLRKFSDMDIVLYMAEFALISSHVRNAIVNNKNTFPFLRSEIGYVGFSRYGIPYARQARMAGKTHYNIFGMFAFAIAGFLTASTFLFRLAVYLFPLVVLANVVLFASYLFFNNSVFFHSLIVLDMLYIIYSLMIHGVYLARIYKNILNRPIYLIDKKLSFINERSLVKKR